MARACGSYPQCHRFESSRRYHRLVRRRQRLTSHPPQQKDGPLVKWLRHGPFTAVTWVRVPYGSPLRQSVRGCRINGGLAQLVRAPASHAGGHWFESSSLHQKVLGFAGNRELFLFIFSNSDAAFWRFSLDPNRDPKAERSGKHRRGANGIIRPSPTIFVGYMVWLMTLPMVSAAERFIPSVA